MNEQQILEKARGVKSVGELRALAKENGYELNDEEAQAYFEQVRKSGELSDDELDSVAGGGCHKKDGRLVVAFGHACEHWACRFCNGTRWSDRTGNCRSCSRGIWICTECKYMSYEKGLWLCNHEANRK